MAGALIGALRVSLSAETSAFEQGMKRSQKTAKQTAGYIRGQFGGIGASLKSSLVGLVGAVTVGSIIAAGKAALEYAGHLGELASTLGLTTKDLQEFSYAAGQVGISQEELQTGIQKLTISIGQAELGAKKQVKAFDAIGISVDDLKGKDAGQVFRLIAERLERVENRSQRAAIEVALFGKAGAKLDNLLSGSQGKLSDLADAAQRLGIVLSDEQIQKADETADKLEALKTVLKARFAGVVADNADAILQMADALGQLAVQAVNALGQVARLLAYIDQHGQPIKDFFAKISDPKNSPFYTGPQVSNAGRLRGLSRGPLPPRSGVSPLAVKPFLDGGGGGGRGKKDHSAEDAARKLYQYQQDELRAQEDILQSKKDLASDYVDQTAISLEILDIQRRIKVAELQHEVQQKDMTQAQADQLLALYDRKDSLDRQKLLDDEETQRAEGYAKLDQDEFDRKREILERQSDLAETQAERRKIELDLLELAYEAKKQALDQILATSKDFVEITNARRDLAQLNKEHALDTELTLQRTRGPLGDYLASLPTRADKANEALERLQVQGMEGFLDSVLALSDGLGAATDSLLDTLKQFVLGLARLELQKLLGGALQGGGGGLGGILGSIGSLFGGGTNYSSQFNADVSGISFGSLPGFATGGSGIFRGLPGRDRNIVSINGMPQFRVSYGERWSVGNDNGSGTRSMNRGGNVYMTVNTPDADSFRRSDGQTVRSLKRRLA